MHASLVAKLSDLARTSPDRVAMKARVDGSWKSWTWGEYHSEVRAIAKGLLALGHQVGDGVALVGKNRPEWVFCELAIMALRGPPAPIYTTNTADQVAFIVDNCGAQIAIGDDDEQIDKFQSSIAEGKMKCAHLITMGASKEGVKSLEDLKALGTAVPDSVLDERIAGITLEETCLLIYTSGTTGTPKGVQLTHHAIASLMDAIRERFSPIWDNYRVVSYLPLCHVAEQIFTTFTHLHTGGEVWFCPDLKEIKDYLAESHPTVFLGVPRVWEKFQAALEARLGSATGVKAALTKWARNTELTSFKEEVRLGKPVTSISRKLANRLVIRKVKAALGLDQLMLAASGAAPISVHTLEFFASLGIVIHEAYGMSETVGVVTISHYGRPRFGTVGSAIKGVQVRIAEDGEVQAKGPVITNGYYRMPKETAELFSDDGWLCTGDLGEIDADGNLKITGRKKDILITAGGKNIAPAEMEAYIQTIVGVAQAVVVGDRKPYLCALVTLDVEALPALRTATGAAAEDVAGLSQDPKVQQWIFAQVESSCNARIASYQTIKRITVLPNEFSVDGGELTPTMKLRRNVVAKKYADTIEQLFV